MDKKTILVKTSKGEDETTSKTTHLYGDLKRTMGLIDNKSTVGELTKRAAPSLRESLEEMLQTLIDTGFVQEKDKAASTLKISKPGMAIPKINQPTAPARSPSDNLNFTDITPTFPEEEKAKSDEAAKASAEAEAARLKAEQEAARIRAEQVAAETKARAEAEAARVRAAQEEARKKAELAAQEKARQEAEAKARAEAARLKAEQEAARIRTEQVAAETKARAEAEAARVRAAQEEARKKAELAAQEKARKEAEAKARAEAETARLKAEQEAARSRAAQAKARAEAEAERIKEQQEVQARERAEAQIRAKAHAEAEAERLKTEQEQARIKAEHEEMQAKAEMEARREEQAKAEAIAKQELVQASAMPPQQDTADSTGQGKGEDQVNKLVQAQAKVWSDAEQRAKERATAKQSESQPATQQTSEVSQAESVPRVRKVRKPLPWGKAGVSLIVLLIAAVFLLPYVWPMQSYVVKLEQKLSAQLQHPVRIGKMHATLLPQPKIELQTVSVGGNREMRAGKVTLNFGMAALFSETKKISSAEIDDLTLSAKSFIESMSWLQAAGDDTHYPVARIVLRQVRVDDLALPLPVMNGSVNFDEELGLVKAVLSSEDGKLGVELQPLQTSWQISVAIRESALPLMPVVFSELSLNGTINSNEANFNEITGYIHGGRVVGNALMNWQNGWQIQGNLNAKSMELKDALPQFGIAGKLNGDAKFTMQAETLPLLAKAPRLEGSFAVKDGVINKIDMVEITKSSGRQGTSGGRTHFDELTGLLLADTEGQRLRQIKISAGVMSAKGNLDVAPGKQPSDKKLSGKMDISLRIRAEMGSTPLSISGTIAEPVLRAGR